MDLNDYSINELKKELESRGFKVSLKATAETTPEWEYIEGEVIAVTKKWYEYTQWEYTVKSDSVLLGPEDKTRMYKVRTGVFNKSEMPEVGDIVRIKCRITARRPHFDPSAAKIFEIVK